MSHFMLYLNGHRPFTEIGHAFRYSFDGDPMPLVNLGAQRRRFVEMDYAGVLEAFGVRLPDPVLRDYKRGKIMSYVRGLSDFGPLREKPGL